MRRQGKQSASQLADVVRTHRHKAGLTQQELAARAGISLAALRDLEQGRRSKPRRGSLAALAEALALDAYQAEDLVSAAAAASRRRRFSSREPGLPYPDPPRGTDPAGSRQGLWLSVLGPLEAWQDGVPISLGPPGRRAVLGMLAAVPGTPVPRGTIIDTLWGQSPPSTAVSLVQAHVSRLRKLFAPRVEQSPVGDAVITAVGSGYRLHMPARQLDLLTFRELACNAEAAWAAGNDLTACDLYEQALGLWRGDPLGGVDVLRDVPCVVELSRQRTDTLIRYAELACNLGLHDRALPRLHALAAAEPLNERVHARLMIALAGAGQQAAAVRVYEDLRARLDREFAIYPSEELVDAHLRVLRQNIPLANSRQTYRQRPSDHEAPRQLPASTRYFTGRDEERTVLSALLERSSRDADGVAIAALTGMAGIGKTALTVHWAHQVADRFPDGQLFVNLRGFCPSGAPVAPVEALHGFLSALGVPAARIPDDIDGRAALYRSMLASRRVLIVLDNARDAVHVRPLLPGSPGCLVLVTSRNRLTGLAAADGACLLSLGVLAEGQSYSLLAKVLGADRVIAEPEAVSELIALCARLPLALRDAAAQAAARPERPLAMLAAEMREERSRLDVLETGEPATSIRVVFSWSQAGLSEAGVRMFRMLGMHRGPDITVPAAAALTGLDRTRAYAAMGELRDEHLITEWAPGRYTSHDLLRAYAAEAVRTHLSETEQRAAVCRLLDYYLHTASTGSGLLYPFLARRGRDWPWPGAWRECLRDPAAAAEWFGNERHVLFAAIFQATDGGYSPHAWELPWAAGLAFTGEWSWHQLAAAQESALALAVRLNDPAGQILARHHLGWLRFWLGEYAEARRHLDEAVELAGQLGDTRFAAMARPIRAQVLRSRERVPEALVLIGQALRLYRTEGDRGGEPDLKAIAWQLAQFECFRTPANRQPELALLIHAGLRAGRRA